MRASGLVLIGSMIVAALFACQQQTQRVVEEPEPDQEEQEPEQEEEEQEPEPETEPTTPGKTDDTCLGKAGLAFSDPECSACMNTKTGCCQATIACFKDDAECKALHACVQGCDGDPLTIWNNEVYPKIGPACGSCHQAGTSGAPIFFGADANATYPLFKAKNYHLPNSLFVTKGLHLGPALLPEARAAVDKWVAAEGAQGGDGGAPDGGGGGANCKEACKTKHAAAVTKWQTYNTCAAVTCKAECL